MTRASFMGIVGSVCISIRGVSSAAFLLAILKVQVALLLLLLWIITKPQRLHVQYMHA